MKEKYLVLSDGKSPHTLKWVKELYKYFETYLISLNGYDKQLLEYIDKDKIYVLNENVNSAGGNFKLLLKYFKIQDIVDKIEPKYVNAHYISSYGLLASLVKNSTHKLILSAWGTDVLVTPFENIIKRKVTTFALNRADLVTSDSHFMSDKIKELANSVNVITFPFGLNSVDLTSEYKKSRNLIFSNRALSKNYNIDNVLKWFKTLDIDMKLIIANDGEMREELQKYVKRNNLSSRVEFVGFLSQKEQEEIYKKATYYISIPSSDSTAVSLLEAMSFGCIPIVSNLPANREWILDGCNGIFWNKELKSLEISVDANMLNRELISKKAIFTKSIKEYILNIESLNFARLNDE